MTITAKEQSTVRQMKTSEIIFVLVAVMIDPDILADQLETLGVKLPEQEAERETILRELTQLLNNEIDARISRRGPVGTSMKSYAKKRETVRAVQWTGSMTPEMTELIGERQVYINGERQLMFSNTKGPGRFAREGDWLMSTSGEDLTVIGDDVFRKTYEEVAAPCPAS